MSSPEILSGIAFLTTFLLFVQNTAEYFFYISFQINNFALSTVCCSFLAVCLSLAIKVALFRSVTWSLSIHGAKLWLYMSKKCLKYHYLFIFQHKVLLISYSVSLYDKIEQQNMFIYLSGEDTLLDACTNCTLTFAIERTKTEIFISNFQHIFCRFYINNTCEI